MSVKEKQSLCFRLKIMWRRESRVCLQTRSRGRDRYGWILNCKGDSVLFKDHAAHRPEIVGLDDIKHCCVIDFE